MSECLFCKIVKREIPSDIVYEDEKVVGFRDIAPKAPIHYLIVPKEHLAGSIKDEGAEEIVSDLILAAKNIAQSQGIAGYRLVFNVGKEGGQIIEHLHLHFLAGQPRELP